MDRLLLLLFVVPFASGHLCILSPRQRGPLDISVGGSPTCFRHGPPCGGQAPEEPKVTLIAGTTAFITWQQNYNHYEPGYPGYMDIAIAPTPESMDFTTLAVVTDRYVHAQDHQENFTAVVRVPAMTCDHCVIRARYNAHKPGEQIFYQCTDVKIYHVMPSSSNALKFKAQIPFGKKHLPLHKMKALRRFTSGKHSKRFADVDTVLYGFAFNPFEQDRSHYIQIDPTTGVTSILNSFDMGIDSSTYRNMSRHRASNFNMDERVGHFFVDEIVSIDYGRNTSNFLVHTTPSRDDAPQRLMILGTMNGSMVEHADIFQFSGGAINGMSWYTFGTSVAFRLQPAQKEGTYIFEVGSLDFGGVYRMLAKTPAAEDLYINFLWFEKDINTHNAFALMGNENAPDKLNARIYIFDLWQDLSPTGTYTLELGQLDFGGTYTKVAETEPEDLYINYMWIESDINNYTLSYALLGNENAPDALNARIYVFDAFNGKFIKATELDVSKFTFMSMHSFPNSYELFAFSPGLMSDKMVQWSLVSINPFQGNVTKVCDIGPPGIFERYYGGSVNQGQSNANELLYHVLRISGSEADVIVVIDPRSCEMNFSDETNLRHIHTLSRGV